MIIISVTPKEIHQGVPTELRLSLRNTGEGPCTHILADLDIPVPLLLIKGSRRIELDTLGAGESFVHRLVLQGSQIGIQVIRLIGGSGGPRHSLKRSVVMHQSCSPSGTPPATGAT